MKPPDTDNTTAERRFFLWLVALWSIAVGIIIAIGFYYIRQDHVAATISHARGAYHNDIIFRKWAAKQGGVYVPSATTRPNPYLKVPDRDVVTTDGKSLTLVNPAYMIRMVHELGTLEFGFTGRIVGIRPLNPVNTPDPWEKSALDKLATGAPEFAEVVEINGKPLLRYLGPMKVNPPCLKCHDGEGYKIGDVRGGISITLPVEPYWTELTTVHGVVSLAGIGFIWALGMGGLYAGMRGRQRYLEDQRQAIATVSRSEQKYRIIVDTAQEGIALFDEEFRLVFCNDHFAAMLGYPMAELAGRHIEEFTFEEDRGDHRDRLAVRRQGTASPYERRFRRGNGSEVWAIVSAQPIMNDDGSFGGSFAMLSDITERKRMEESIRTSLHEKEMLLKEIHHRVKNNLQIISSLLNLQSVHSDDKKLRPLLQESQNRVRTMALIHEKLYRAENLSVIDFGVYIRELARYLFRSYQVGASCIRLKVDTDEITFGIDTAVPCGLLLNELVSNALKHAFPDNREGELAITLRRIDDMNFILTVADTGVGLPEGFDCERAATLGMELIWSLTKQLDGKLEINSTGGAAFVITFKRQD